MSEPGSTLILDWVSPCPACGKDVIWRQEGIIGPLEGRLMYVPTLDVLCDDCPELADADLVQAGS